MAEKLNWGILATGGIAHQFAKGLKKSKTGTLTAVGSRSMESAKKFTDEHGGKPYASYQEVLDDPEVEAIYIALPHHMHHDWTIKCAEAKKAILCEKPFTLNAHEAQRALNVVRENKVFFMEAFMYRCHPQTLKVLELVKSGVIGDILAIHADFGFAASRDWNNFRADGALGGGGLMDVGTYCVSFSRLMAGAEPTSCKYSAVIGEKGYDEVGAGVLNFPNNVIAYFGTGIHVNLKNDATIYGSKGKIHVPNPWKCSEGGATLHVDGQPAEKLEFKSTNDELYALEADTVAEFVEKSECPYMTWQDTLDNMRALDSCRESAGLKFAMESTE